MSFSPKVVCVSLSWIAKGCFSNSSAPGANKDISSGSSDFDVNQRPSSRTLRKLDALISILFERVTRQMSDGGFERAQDGQLSDKLLTALTLLLSLLVFVVAPLEANGVIAGRSFGLVFGMILIPAAFMLAANRLAA